MQDSGFPERLLLAVLGLLVLIVVGQFALKFVR